MAHGKLTAKTTNRFGDIATTLRLRPATAKKLKIFCRKHGTTPTAVVNVAIKKKLGQ